MQDTSVKKPSRAGSAVFRIIIIVIAGLVVGMSVFSWNAQRLVGNQLPMPFGIGASVILSPSMEPVLHTNDLVFVAEQDEYRQDDIVVYQDGTMLVIHRIVSISDDVVITKGDANNVADRPIELSQIKGKMVFRIPYVGLVVKFIKTVPGTLLILLLAVFLMYRSRQKERSKDNEEMDRIVAEIRRLQQLQGVQPPAEQPVAQEPVVQQPPAADPPAEASAVMDAPAALAEEAEPVEDAPAPADQAADDDAPAMQLPVAEQHGEDVELADVHALIEDLDD